jgi:hypothetical protein
MTLYQQGERQQIFKCQPVELVHLLLVRSWVAYPLSCMAHTS